MPSIVVVDERNMQDEVEAQEVSDIIQAAIATLPPAIAAIVHMRYFCDLSADEIKSRLGQSRAVAAEHRKLAIDVLRDALAGSLDSEH